MGFDERFYHILNVLLFSPFKTFLMLKSFSNIFYIYGIKQAKGLT